MITVLIDGDIVAYRSAASCQKREEDGTIVLVEPLEIAIKRADELLQRIVDTTGATAYRVFITGNNNFRYEIYKDYKVHRKDVAKPAYLYPVIDHLIEEWNAIVSDGVEADDLMGIAQCEALNAPYKPMDVVKDETIISSIDKDLLMIPGRHYNFVKDEFYDVSEIDGMRHFYFQLIMGDRSDNIPGYDGIMRVKVPKFLLPKVNELMSLDNEKDMDALVKEMYTDTEQYEINKQLLWILREPRDQRDME